MNITVKDTFKQSYSQMKFSKFLLLFSPESSVFPFTAQNYKV